ncbi:hypothetical protein D9619_006336 [Psilocybe cf. subviscida]|uniref:Sulfhydryl oxidase n=1 Tax=Psilocybe cf. subviscida TaxID=2480587 RepID=A0A8H5EXH6_9AGAR|nr:hypothetical protein D9619_006336 [Psilocybe cf. subviscida]
MAAENASASPPKKPAASNMPPGMIMGPDGKPCKICTAFRNWKPGQSNQTEEDSNRAPRKWTAPVSQQQQARGQSSANVMAGFAALTGGTTAASGSASTSKQAEAETHSSPEYRGDGPPPGCPPDVEQLGRATWTFLHTTAAYYPDKPTPTQRANMLMLLRSLPIVYPCTWCATDFGEEIEKSKPDVSSRVALSRWLCEQHNTVNEKLGKEKFDCAKTDERWKDGPADGSCD